MIFAYTESTLNDGMGENFEIWGEYEWEKRKNSVTWRPHISNENSKNSHPCVPLIEKSVPYLAPVIAEVLRVPRWHGALGFYFKISLKLCTVKCVVISASFCVFAKQRLKHLKDAGGGGLVLFANSESWVLTFTHTYTDMQIPPQHNSNLKLPSPETHTCIMFFEVLDVLLESPSWRPKHKNIALIDQKFLIQQ